MQSKSIKADSVTALQAQIDQIIEHSFQPTLAIVFTSPAFSLTEITNTFDSRGIELFGLTTAGEIVDGELVDSSIVGLVFDINKDYYQLHFIENNLETLFKTGQAAGEFAKNQFKHPALIIGSGGVVVDAEQIIYGYLDVLGEGVPIFGGLAGDDFELKETLAFTHQQITNNGVVTLILDNDKIAVDGLAICGWEPIGNVNTITKAEGNIVYTINDEPALDVFIRYFGYFDNTEVKGKPVSSVSAQYPLQLFREDGTTVLRSPLVGDETEKTLTFAGSVKNGDKFRFSIAPGFEVIDQTVSEFGDFNAEIPETDAVILFSCKGRHAALGPLIEDEVEGIYNYWNKPMIGFFSYGEIGNTKGGGCDFHNETCSLVLLKEK